MPQNAAFIRDAAEPALLPSKPKVIVNMLLGTQAGLILGIAIAFFLEYLDTSIKTMNDVRTLFMEPVLAVVPTEKRRRLTSSNGKYWPTIEAYRILTASADRFCNDGTTCFSVTSGSVSEGKSTTVYNLARAWAKAGKLVLVVDGDTHRASQHQLFGLNNDLGLSDCLAGTVTLHDAALPTKIDGLFVLTAGAVTEAFNAEAMKQLIDSAREHFDIILIDSPPILAISTALTLCRLVDSSILVVQQGQLPRSILHQVRKAIEQAGGHLCGLVLNKVDIRYDEAYSYSTSYRHYYPKRSPLLRS
jgi:polysaccharide biosynthesis transport protein